MNQLQAVFVEKFAIPADVPTGAWRYRELPGWDSVAHMYLVAALEDAFGIMLETEDVLDLSSFDQAVVILRRYEVPLDA